MAEFGVKMFMARPIMVEARRFNGYTEALPPGAWNNYVGGELWEWLNSHGQDIHLDQQDPGPAYAWLYTTEGMMRVDIGDIVVKGLDGFRRFKPEVFSVIYKEL